MVALESVIEAFEEAQVGQGGAAIEEFLPDREHPEYAAIVCELIRVDLEYTFQRGCRQTAADYGRRFPKILADPTKLEQVAFEEYRLCRQAGEPVTPQDYALRYGIATDDWPLGPLSPGENGSVAADGMQPSTPVGDTNQKESRFAARPFPDVNQRLLGFHLVQELGRGTFARVYLARQADLSNRSVALKVTTRFTSEPDWLAQLQHTNIVPIYSLHRVHGLEAVCMPYLGATTFASLLAQFRARRALPASGVELAATIEACNDVTQAGDGASSAPRPSRGASRTPARPSPAFAELCCRLSYVDAVVWIVERVARGLAHAHQRSIVHRDLKPANLLLADHGEPMILDFNLAAEQTHDAVQPDTAGGTLPYMAPEQLEMLPRRPIVDARCDVYSMGVILFEMLTGQLPFPAHTGPVETQLPLLVADRRMEAPSARRVRNDVSRDVDAIIRRCLDPEPAARYASACQLQEDLQRHLEHRPLRYAPDRSPQERLLKWTRRHPRLASASSVTAISAAVVLLLAASWMLRGQQLSRLKAREQLTVMDHAIDTIRAPLTSIELDAPMLKEGMAAAHEQLERYHVLPDANNWTSHPAYRSLGEQDQDRLRERIVEILYLLAGAAQHESQQLDGPETRRKRLGEALQLCRLATSVASDAGGNVPRALLMREADLLEACGDKDKAEQQRKDASRVATATAMDRFLMATEEARKANYTRAASLLERVRDDRSRDFSTWFLLGNCRAGLGEPYDAEGCFTTAIALAPTLPWGYYHRGLCRLDLKKFRGAEEDFSQVLALRPKTASALLNRAIAQQGQGNIAPAVQDLTAALEAGGPSRIYFLRARYWKQLGRHDSAEQDIETGLHQQPTDEKSWIARGIAWLEKDPQKALKDFETARAMNPRCVSAWHNMAHVLAEQLGRNEDAIDALDELLAIQPRYVAAVAGRGVIYARIGQRENAIADARAAMRLSRDAKTLYQVACIYALTSRTNTTDATQALQLLSRAVQGDMTWGRRAKDDPDLEPLRGNPEFQSLLSSVDTLIEMGDSRGRNEP